MILLVLSALWLSLLGIVWIFAAKPSWAWREDEFASIEQWAQLRLALGHMIALGGVIPPGPAERPSRGRSSSRRPRDTFSTSTYAAGRSAPAAPLGTSQVTPREVA